jgi:hypothetical protein
MNNRRQRKLNKDYPLDLLKGDKLYYNCIDDKSKAEALSLTTKSSLNPYYNFLNEVINSEEEKGSHEIEFEEIIPTYLLAIKPIYNDFEIKKPETKLIIKNENISIEDVNTLTYTIQNKLDEFNKNDVESKNGFIYIPIDRIPKDNETIQLNHQPICLVPPTYNSDYL